MAAFRTVEELSTDPDYIGYYDYDKAIKQELELSFKEGFENGLKEVQNEIIQKMISNGMTIDSISQMLEMPKEEIKKLIETTINLP